MDAFAAGQRWSYRTRPGEEGSTLLILKVQELPQGTVIGIRVEGVRLQNPFAAGGVQDVLPHAPILAPALAECTTRLLEAGVELPLDEEPYLQWWQAYEHDEAGVFGIGVAEIVQAVETAAAEAHAPDDAPERAAAPQRRRWWRRGRPTHPSDNLPE